MENPAIWNDPKRAQELGREKRSLEEVLNTIDHLTSNLSDNAELYEMTKAESDFDGLAGIVIGAILLVAPRHAGTTAALVRFAAIGLLLAACVSGLGHSGDREFLAQLRVAYDAWRTTHP